jgi:hypothetical protein
MLNEVRRSECFFNVFGELFLWMKMEKPQRLGREPMLVVVVYGWVLSVFECEIV